MATNTTTPNYAIDYEDERFTQVEAEKDAAISEMEGTYDSMIGQSDKFYQDQIDASKEWADKQSQLQQEQSDFAIEQIEQQKQQANKDYIKEQSGAYVDWQKQSDQYGVNAEKQASAGLAGTGYSESSQVAMYNQYQNRVTTARESYNQAVLNYNNAIKDARLQNNAILAEIAYNALQQQLELALQGFQYKNTLVLDKLNTKIELDNQYYQRYQDVLAQMNTENAMAEQIRQYNQNYQLELEKYNESKRQWQLEYDQGVKAFNEQIRQWTKEYERLIKKDEAEAKAEAARLAEQIKQREQQQRQWEAEMKEKQRQFNKTFEAQYGNNAKITKSTGGSSTQRAAQSAGVTRITGSNPVQTSNKNTQPTINQQSVAALGYGPVSEKRLAELVASGAVIATEKNGQIYFTRNKNAVPSIQSPISRMLGFK